MGPLTIIKSVSELVVSIGAGAVVGNAIKVSTPETAKIIQKIAIGVGGAVLSSMVGDLAAKYATGQIEDAAGKVNNFWSKAKEKPEEVK